MWSWRHHIRRWWPRPTGGTPLDMEHGEPAAVPPEPRRVTAEDVRACYRAVLGREPESEALVEAHVRDGTPLWSLVAAMVRSPEHLRQVGSTGPYSLLKFRDGDYPIRGLTEHQRASCLFHSYEALRRGLDRPAMEALLKGPLTLLRGERGGSRFEVALSLFEDHLEEGELTFWLAVDGVRIHLVQLTIAPAELFDLGTGSALIVSRVQGVRGTGDLNHRLGKACGEIAPAHLLLCVVQGVALALGSEWLVGADQRAVRSFGGQPEEAGRASYDALFANLGSTRLPGGLHAVALPRRERPLEELAAGRRARTRLKRAAKQALVDEARRNWTALMPPAPVRRRPVPVAANDTVPRRLVAIGAGEPGHEALRCFNSD